MKITVVDYGLSNLLSVRRAITSLGYEVEVTGDAATVRQASVLVLPGVGAFRDGMKGLDSLGLTPVIRGKTAEGTPLLGICLGMQMLFSQSEEFGVYEGLGLIPGSVVRIPDTTTEDRLQRVPQVGWNGLLPPEAGASAFSSPLLAATRPGEEVYFVHSYEAKPENPQNCLANVLYGGREVCAVAGLGRVLGTQFHPEKSGRVGLAILQQYLQWATALSL
ncbi:MAG: imidazole glycerol phosphate synthase subunit HisH [Oscillospiraceae bacterium]